MDKLKGEIIFYSVPGRKAAVEVRLEQDTVWLSLTQMAERLDATSRSAWGNLKS